MPSFVGPAPQKPAKNPFDQLLGPDGKTIHPVIDMLAKHLYGPKMQAAQVQDPAVQPQGWGAPITQPISHAFGRGGGDTQGYVDTRGVGNPNAQGAPSGTGGMAKFQKRFNTLFPFLLQAGEPLRAQAANAAAIGGQTALQANQAQMARAGLGGSGYALSSENAINAGTQANINQALVSMYEQAIQQAIEGAYSKKHQTRPPNPHNTPPWAQYAQTGASIGLLAAADQTDPQVKAWLRSQEGG